MQRWTCKLASNWIVRMLEKEERKWEQFKTSMSNWLERAHDGDSMRHYRNKIVRYKEPQISCLLSAFECLHEGAHDHQQRPRELRPVPKGLCDSVSQPAFCCLKAIEKWHTCFFTQSIKNGLGVLRDLSSLEVVNSTTHVPWSHGHPHPATHRARCVIFSVHNILNHCSPPFFGFPLSLFWLLWWVAWAWMKKVAHIMAPRCQNTAQTSKGPKAIRLFIGLAQIC